MPPPRIWRSPAAGPPVEAIPTARGRTSTAGLEPATSGFGGQRSIQLSYADLGDNAILDDRHVRCPQRGAGSATPSVTTPGSGRCVPIGSAGIRLAGEAECR